MEKGATGTTYSSGAPKCTPSLSKVRIARSLVFYVTLVFF